MGVKYHKTAHYFDDAVDYSFVKFVCYLQVALMGQALCELLRTPDKCRDALRVTLHLVSYSRTFSINYI